MGFHYRMISASGRLFHSLIINCVFVLKQLGLSTGVIGQNIPPAGLYPGLKRPSLDYTRVYYGLGQVIPRGILWPRLLHTPSGQIIHQ